MTGREKSLPMSQTSKSIQYGQREKETSKHDGLNIILLKNSISAFQSLSIDSIFSPPKVEIQSELNN